MGGATAAWRMYECREHQFYKLLQFILDALTFFSFFLFLFFNMTLFRFVCHLGIFFFFLFFPPVWWIVVNRKKSGWNQSSFRGTWHRHSKTVQNKLSVEKTRKLFTSQHRSRLLINESIASDMQKYINVYICTLYTYIHICTNTNVHWLCEKGAILNKERKKKKILAFQRL